MLRKSLIGTSFILIVAVLVVVAARTPQAQTAQPASLVLTNGRIVTVEASPAEAQAIAVQGDRILAIGSAADMKRHIGPGTEVIDLKGQLAIPGFVESHGHFTGVGQAQLNLNLMKTTSWPQIVSMVEQAAKNAKPGQWT